MDPEDISVALGMKPQYHWKVGERRTTPTGQLLTGVNESTYWCSAGVDGQGFALAESLSSHLLMLERRREFLTEFVSTGGSVDYFVAWFTDGMNTGATLDWELLKRLGALQIDLDLDVYGGRSIAGPRSNSGEPVRQETTAAPDADGHDTK